MGMFASAWRPACVCVGLLGVAGCFPSESVSWRIAIVRDDEEASVVHLKWGPGTLRPTITERSVLKTIDRPNDVWVASDERLYATWEISGSVSSWNHHVRVYLRDGSMVGEYRGDQEDRYVSPPVIVEENKKVCFVTGSGKIMVGRPDGEPVRCVFAALPTSLPVDFRKAAPTFAKTYEIDKSRVVFAVQSGDQWDVYEVSLEDGSHTRPTRGELFGVIEGKPVVIDWDNWRIIVHGDYPRQIGGVHFGGIKSPYRIARLSPCGKFYMYDAGQFKGFRLRVAERRPWGPECVLDELGHVTSLGSWWAN